jgi:nucleotide-binding universal stress UspA family protein
MRVLLAIDGSESADLARQLVAGILWPAGSVVRIVTAVDYRTEFVAAPWLIPTEAESLALDRPTLEAAQRLVDEAAATMPIHGIEVEEAVLRGRPSTAIVAQARQFRPDLIALGSRGNGPLRSMLLGSVSSEVVEQAPFPVLIARRGRLSSVLVADDQSDSARHALELLEAWPIFRTLPVSVLSVSDMPAPLMGGAWGAGDVELAGMYQTAVERDLASRREHVGEVVKQLRRVGFQATGAVESGDAAGTIVRTAKAQDVDLVFVGSRGRTSLASLVLGSVARNVVHNSSASVLVLRQAPAPAKALMADALVPIRAGSAFG